MNTFGKLVIAAFALSATAALAHGNKQEKSAAAQSGLTAQNLQQDETLVRQAQQALNDKGFDAGSPSGSVDAKTQAALKKFQQSQGISSSGQLDGKTLVALGVQSSASAQGSSDMQSSSSQSSSSRLLWASNEM